MLNCLKCKQNIYKNDPINISKLIYQYYALSPDPNNVGQKIKFGTAGHRGISTHYTFNESHILAITQAIVEQRKKMEIYGPCYLGKDTHALSEIAFISVLEVLSANAIDVIIQGKNVYTPTPIITHAVLNYNKNIRNNHLRADAIVITSSHNPPEYGGIKYYSYYGGIANTNITDMIEKYANMLLFNNLRTVKRITIDQVWRSDYVHILDFTHEYVIELTNIIDMQSIKQSGLKLGIDPMGGAGIECWYRIAEFYKFNLVFINEIIDPTFQFIPLNAEGIIRIDCSSERIMTKLLNIRNKFDLIFANDPDCDRYGIITPMGFINSCDYLLIAIHYLFHTRLTWNKTLGIGKTLVSSSMIDYMVKTLHRSLIEVPIGFKWFVKGLFYGILGFAGEESAGGIFLNFNSKPWSTDKDGIVMCLLAAEMSNFTGKILQEYYQQCIANFGSTFSYYCTQIPICCTSYKRLLNTFILKQIARNSLVNDLIIKKVKIMSNARTTRIDGIKLITHNGWIAFRNSGTENTYKIYCESFLGKNHRKKMESEIFQ